MKKEDEAKENEKVKAPKKVKEPKAKIPKIRKPINKEGLIIAIVVAIVVLLTIGIIVYYFYFADNEKIATYNGGELTRGEYELYYKRYAPMLTYYGYSSDEITEYVATKAVLDELIYKDAVKAGIKISDEDKKEVDEQFASEDTIKAIQEQGMDVNEIKQSYYNDKVIASYIEDLEEATTTEDVKAYIIEREGENADFNLYNTSHILLQITDEMTDTEKLELKKKAEKLLKVAKTAGSDFAKLAKENSSDSSKDDGGKITIRNNGEVYDVYSDAVLTLKAGQIYSKVVESPAGYHIIKLNSIDKNGRITNQDDIESCVDAQLYKRLDEAKYEADEDRISQIGTTLGQQLGIITNETNNDDSTAATE